MVSVNGKLEGPTPLDQYYTWYGKYHLTIVKDGYETLQVDQRIRAPWYEIPPLDFFVENVWPFKVRDMREFHYVLQPVQGVRPEDVLNRGAALRAEGQQVQRLPDSKQQVPRAPSRRRSQYRRQRRMARRLFHNRRYCRRRCHRERRQHRKCNTNT